MNGTKQFVLTFVLTLIVSCLLAAPVTDTDSSINDLYESLLQREYTGPVSLSDHQVERKAVRSPSLRLRFGRRGDPDLAPLQGVKLTEKINQKPIRSPSLRLRFGRRNDPNFPSLSEDLLDDELGLRREERKPSRLRWGRSATNEYSSENADDNTYKFEPSLPSMRIRWGKITDAENLDNMNYRTGRQLKPPSKSFYWGRNADEEINLPSSPGTSNENNLALNN